jgi:hypothetical protein
MRALHPLLQQALQPLKVGSNKYLYFKYIPYQISTAPPDDATVIPWTSPRKKKPSWKVAQKDNVFNTAEVSEILFTPRPSGGKNRHALVEVEEEEEEKDEEEKEEEEDEEEKEKDSPPASPTPLSRHEHTPSIIGTDAELVSAIQQMGLETICTGTGSVQSSQGQKKHLRRSAKDVRTFYEVVDGRQVCLLCKWVLSVIW